MTINERAWRYLEKLPPSIQGSGGSVALFEAACVLVKGFALSLDQAWPLLLKWNQTHAQPPWTEKDLRHKIVSAERSSRVGGYLQGGEYERKMTISPDFEFELEKRARRRKSWPRFRPPTSDEIDAIARLRQIPAIGVLVAARLGYLRATTFEGHECFVITEGTFAQAARVDGGMLKTRDGTSLRKKNLPGSEGVVIGRQHLGGGGVRVLIVEGVIGIVEALAAHHLVNPVEGWTVVAATSAGSRFVRDPELLEALRGRRVRILADPGKAGEDGATAWMTDLVATQCNVEVVKLPDNIKDFGPLLTHPQIHQETLNAIFQ
jgi:hypothetical protein